MRVAERTALGFESSALFLPAVLLLGVLPGVLGLPAMVLFFGISRSAAFVPRVALRAVPGVASSSLGATFAHSPRRFLY